MTSVKYCGYFLFIMGFIISSTVSIEARRYRKKMVKKTEEKNFILQSSAFDHNSDIPTKYTCDGEEASPPLRWSNVPEGTQSFALICEDPDAAGKTWIHWIVFNIPETIQDFPTNVDVASLGGVEGTTNWDTADYGGPCPPLGKHRYVFTMYALKVAKLDLTSSAKIEDLKRAMQDKIIGSAVLIGKYERSTEND